MPFEEKLTWVNMVVTLIVAAVYAWIVGGQVAGNDVSHISFQIPLLVAMGAMIALTIIGTITVSIATAISRAIKVEVSGEGTTADALADMDRRDERDTHISRHGDRVGYYVSSGLMLGALALSMLRSDQFWIANAIFGAFVVAGLVSSIAKIAAYRRGF